MHAINIIFVLSDHCPLYFFILRDRLISKSLRPDTKMMNNIPIRIFASLVFNGDFTLIYPETRNFDALYDIFYKAIRLKTQTIIILFRVKSPALGNACNNNTLILLLLCVRPELNKVRIISPEFKIFTTRRRRT